METNLGRKVLQMSTAETYVSYFVRSIHYEVMNKARYGK
jgi:hypothetical protein